MTQAKAPVETNRQEFLQDSRFYYETGEVQEQVFSATQESGFTLDFTRHAVQDPEPWTGLGLSQQKGKKPCHIILSDIQCLVLLNKKTFRKEFLSLTALIAEKFLVSGMDSRGKLIPISLAATDEAPDSPAFDRHCRSEFKKLKQMKFQAAPSEKITEQLSSQGFDVEEFCVLDASTMSEVINEDHLKIVTVPEYSQEAMIALLTENIFLQYLKDIEISVPLTTELEALLQKCIRLGGLRLDLNGDLSPMTSFWQSVKNIKQLTLGVKNLTKHHFPTSILGNLQGIILGVQGTAYELPLLSPNLILFALSLVNNTCTSHFIKSVSSFAWMQTLKNFYINFPLSNYQVLPKNIERLSFHCGLLTSLDFTDFPKLIALKIYHYPQTAAPKITGFTGIPEFTPQNITVIDSIEQPEPDYPIDTTTFTPPDKQIALPYTIKQKNSQGVIEDFPHRAIRQTVENPFLTFEGEAYITGWEELEIEKVPARSLRKDSCLAVGQAICRLKLPAGCWQQLPRRHINDQIKQMAVPEGSEIRYNLRLDQYEILLPGKEPGFIQYTMEPFLPGKELQRIPRTSTVKELSPHLRGLYTRVLQHLRLDSFLKFLCYLTKFTNLPLSDNPITGRSHGLVDIIVQGKGACRHRAAAAVVLGTYFGEKIRPIKNKPHDFIEVYNPSQGVWAAIDLDGHAAHTIPPTESPWCDFFSAEKQSTKDYQSLAEVFDDLTSRSGWRLDLPDLSAARTLYTELYHYLQSKPKPPPLCYAESGSELLETSQISAIQKDGSLTTLPGFLLTDVLPAGGVLLGGPRFDPSEIVTYKSTLDTPPTLFGNPIDGVKVISLTTPEMKACSAFYSRTAEFKWPEKFPLTEAPKVQGKDEVPSQEGVAAKSPRMKRKREDAVAETSLSTPSCLKIDLYGDKYLWQSLLLGLPEPRSEGFGFLEGALADSKLQTGNAIVELIDAPLADEKFQSFLLHRKVEKTVKINDRLIHLPHDFRWAYGQPKPTITQPTVMEEEPLSDDSFYLNQRSFPLLFKQQKLDDDHYLLQVNGWLSQQTLSSKDKLPDRQIVQTQELTPGQMRRIARFIEENPQQNIRWIKLESDKQCQAKRSKTSASVREDIFPPAPTVSITVCSDPYFVELQWRRRFSLTHAIHAKTPTSDLLERIQSLPTTKHDSKASTKIKCSYQLQEVAKTLLEGRDVLLYGQWNEDIYLAFESMLRAQRYLLLCKAHFPAGKLGSIFFVTDSAPQQTTSETISQKVLWLEYEKQLVKELGGKFKPKDWQKVQSFCHTAEQLSVAVSISITYTRLRSILLLLQQPCFDEDNPIKALFHHAYPHDSEHYAFLNVLAKYVFGPNLGSPGIRTKKLASYGDNPACFWQRLNCLNAKALHETFDRQGPALNFTRPPRIDWQALTRTYAKNEIKSNPSPMTKLFNRITQGLKQQRMLVLQGPPGSRALHAACTRGAEYGETFLASDPEQIIAWLNCKTPAVLIADRADFKPFGHWEDLRPLLAGMDTTVVSLNFNGKRYENLSAGLRVIFITKSVSDAHKLLQEIPTLHLSPGTNDDLKHFIMSPIVQRLLGRNAQHRSVISGMDRLLKCYRWMQDHLANHQISPTDLQAVTFRWASALKKAIDRGFGEGLALMLANEACRKQWYYRFILPQQTQSFEDFLESMPGFEEFDDELAVEIEGYRDYDFQGYKDSRFQPSVYQQTIGEWIMEDLDLALQAQHLFQSTDIELQTTQAILLEGDSGFGKSEVLLQIFFQKGYRQATLKELAAAKPSLNCSKRFIQFTASKNFTENKRLLEMAFDKGYAVLLDELNVSPELRDLLMDLLSGKTSMGKHATTPGFFLAATQNSGTQQGRKNLPLELLNLLHVFYVREHNESQLLDYMDKLFFDDLDDGCMKKIVQSYLHARKENSKNVNDRIFFQKISKLRERLTAVCSASRALTRTEKTELVEEWLESGLETAPATSALAFFPSPRIPAPTLMATAASANILGH